MIRFNPWEGSAFVGGTFEGQPCKLMILGESHHDNNPEQATEDMTVDTVTQYIEAINHEGWHDYFTKVHRLVRGRDTITAGAARRGEFWHSVLFYNYIQEIIATEAHSTPPTRAMWLEARAPFVRVLAKHKPTHLIATGVSLWQHLTSEMWRELIQEDGDNVVRFHFEGDGNFNTLAIGVNHPAGGLSYDEIPRVTAFLRLRPN